MQLAYELLPVRAGKDENLPTAILKLRRRSPLYGKHPWQVLRRALNLRQIQQLLVARHRTCEAGQFSIKFLDHRSTVTVNMRRFAPWPAGRTSISDTRQQNQGSHGHTRGDLWQHTVRSKSTSRSAKAAGCASSRALRSASNSRTS
jgi:hypothetical protein